MRSNKPRKYQRKSEPYQPLSPPISSIASHKLFIDASVIRIFLSRRIISPAHSGSDCAFCHGANGDAASDQRVVTVLLDTLFRAKATARSTSINPSLGGGIKLLIDFFGSATTSLINEPTNGRASEVGTGVTKPIQRLESFGVSTGTLIINLFLKPDNLANFCIISA